MENNTFDKLPNHPVKKLLLVGLRRIELRKTCKRTVRNAKNLPQVILIVMLHLLNYSVMT